MAKAEGVNQLQDVAPLRFPFFQKLLSCGDCVKKVGNTQIGARRAGGGGSAGDAILADLNTDALGHIGLFGMQGDLCNSSNAGKCFAAKAVGLNLFQLVDLLNFAGRVPFKTELSILFVHAAAIIDDTQELLSTIFDVDGDGGCPGINAVFE